MRICRLTCARDHTRAVKQAVYPVSNSKPTVFRLFVFIFVGIFYSLLKSTREDIVLTFVELFTRS